MHDELPSQVEEDLHKYNLPCAFAFQKQNTYMHIFRGSLLLLMKTIPKSFTISHTFIPVENFNQFVINHQKGGDCKCI